MTDVTPSTTTRKFPVLSVKDLVLIALIIAGIVFSLHAVANRNSASATVGNGMPSAGNIKPCTEEDGSAPDQEFPCSWNAGSNDPSVVSYLLNKEHGKIVTYYKEKANATAYNNGAQPSTSNYSSGKPAYDSSAGSKYSKVKTSYFNCYSAKFGDYSHQANCNGDAPQSTYSGSAGTTGSNNSSKYSKVKTAYFNCFSSKFNDYSHNPNCSN